MKKAQMMGQVFIFLLATLLIGFILIFGYNSIKKFNDKVDTVGLAKFKDDLSNTVGVVSTDYGRVKTQSFSAPAGITKICFVKSFPELIADTTSPTNGHIFSEYPLMKDSIDSQVNQNVFLISSKVEESFYIGEIDVDGEISCIEKVSGNFKIRFEGKGNHALIS